MSVALTLVCELCIRECNLDSQNMQKKCLSATPGFGSGPGPVMLAQIHESV